MYRNEPLDKYLKDAASGTPTPGGGSVAALVGALATTMSSMSANFTVGKEKFKHYDSQLKRILGECEESRETLLSLMEEDIKVYSGITNAYGLPKSTDAEKNKRSEEIQKATITAMEVPFKTTMCCLYVLEQTRELVEAAFQCAKLNVDINLATIKNQGLVEKTQNELSHAEEKAKTFFKEIQGKVQKIIKG